MGWRTWALPRPGGLDVEASCLDRCSCRAPRCLLLLLRSRGRPRARTPWDRSGSPAALGIALRPGALTLSSTASISCYSYDVPDGTGNCTGGLDAVDYKLSYDCVHHVWIATITTAQAFSTSQLGDVQVDLDTDNNLSDNCQGVDWAMVATYVPQIGGLATGAVKFGGNCNGSVYSTLKTTRTSPRTTSRCGGRIRSSVRRASFGSVAFVSGKQNATGSDCDAIPNRGLVVSQKTTTTSFTAHTGPTVDTAYTQIVSGDFDGDGHDDMLFYGVGGHPEAACGSARRAVASPRSRSRSGATTR